MTNHLYAQFADDGQTIANVCVVLDVGTVTESGAGTFVAFGIAEAEALGWAWLGEEANPNVDPATGLVPWTGWTATPPAAAALPVGHPSAAVPTIEDIAAGQIAIVAPTPAIWTFSPPADA